MECVGKMAGCVYEMIEPLVNKLKEATINEVQFQWAINEEIRKLSEALGELKQVALNAKPETSLAKVEEARQAAFDIEDGLEEYELEMELKNITGRAFRNYLAEAKLRFQLHQKVKKMKVDPVQRADEGQTTPEEDEDDTASPIGRYQRREKVHIVGRDTEFSQLTDLVEQPRNPFQVITVWGPGGSGKTTLVNQVFETVRTSTTKRSTREKGVETDGKINCCAWVSVNQSSPMGVLRSMVKEISRAIGKPVPKDEELLRLSHDGLQKWIHDDLEQKRYFLILDDVWNPEAIEYIPLPTDNKSSVIITSRQRDIAVKFIVQLGCSVGSPNVELHPLNRELSWDLFCESAFVNNNPPGSCPDKSIEDIGRELVKICDGLPLAILAIGNLMSIKGDDLGEWVKVRDELPLELQGDLAGLNRVLLLSYRYLPVHLKPCFLYCAMFPKSVPISIHKLIRLWIAEGFVKNDERHTLEAVARGYFDKLINRSMLQFRAGSKGFQIHDLLREVAVHMIAKENFGKLLYQNTMVEDQRRLAIHAPNVQFDSSCRSKLRSLITASGGMFFSSFSQLLRNIKLIRTLDLEGVHNINHVPDEVGDLIHLRFLSFRRTWIWNFPDSVKKLRHLQTLDVRRNVVYLVPGIAELKQLRHLLIGGYNEMPDINFDFLQLQSLDGAHLFHNQARELIRTTQLTKLNISFDGEESWRHISSAIRKMKNLRTLKLKGYSVKKTTLINLGNLSTSPSLEKLQLVGFTGVRDFIASHKRLREIKLRHGDLDERCFVALGQLPRLEDLHIHDNYQGTQLICEPESFPALKVFEISDVRDLIKWSKIPKGSMKCLRRLSIYKCLSLQMLPDGLQALGNLQQLALIGMQSEFLQRIDTRGPDHWKIQQIPIIRIAR